MKRRLGRGLGTTSTSAIIGEELGRTRATRNV